MLNHLISRIGQALGATRPAPDLCRFPDLPPIGYDAAWVARAERLRVSLETPQYKALRAARRQKASSE